MPEHNESLIYLDNAATSWPKPPSVGQAVIHFMEEAGANPGRSAHRLSIEAARRIYAAREAAAEIFNAAPLQVAFTQNATMALNLALYGLLRAGDHVITSSIEHNSVMRPLRRMEKNGVEVSVIPCSPWGVFDPDDVRNALKPNTRMIVVTHSSNVTGTVLPIRSIGEIARQVGVLLLTDEAQTAGAFPIDMKKDFIDLIAFTGHKGLYGPPGTGGLVIGERVNIKELQPLLQGGTGSRSEYEEQPDFMPDCLESGTPNGAGLAGLEAGIRWVLDNGILTIRQHEIQLCRQLLEGLSAIEGVTITGPREVLMRTGVVSFTIDRLQPSEVGQRLDEEYGILCRVGLHCAPAAHKTWGSFPGGTVRFSVGAFNTSAQIQTTLEAVGQIASQCH
jgi:cysteine desulfurase / selenocysteine lyase